MPLAEPISELLLDRSDAGLVRIAIFGLWVFTMYEFLLALFRLDERARAFLAFTVSNVLVTIPATVWLVVVEEEGAQGLLLGQYATGAVFLAALLITQRRRLALIPDFLLLRRMTRFGLPTMPAELSLYSLNFIDRVLLVRLAGLADAGLYALSVKFAQAVNVLVKGFQLAWPPLAYSIEDDDEARRAYAVIVTWFVAVCTFFVAGHVAVLPLDRPRTGGARVLPVLRGDRAGLHRGDALRALSGPGGGARPYRPHRVQLPGHRSGHRRQHRPQPLLVPSLGIVGAGVSLVASYAVVLVLMYVFTQRLFQVPYEWLRLGQVAGAGGGPGGGGRAAAAHRWDSSGSPPAQRSGSPTRRASCVTGFLSDEERRAAAANLTPSRSPAPYDASGEPTEPPTESAEAPAKSGPRLTREALAAEQRDEDASEPDSPRAALGARPPGSAASSRWGSSPRPDQRDEAAIRRGSVPT